MWRSNLYVSAIRVDTVARACWPNAPASLCRMAVLCKEGVGRLTAQACGLLHVFDCDSASQLVLTDLEIGIDGRQPMRRYTDRRRYAHNAGHARE